MNQAIIMFILGFFASLFIGISKLIKLYNHEHTILVTDNPWFYIALIAMILGSQLFLAGFIGELILRTKRDDGRYTVSKKINI
jgi:hypothetical protein